MAEVAEPQAGGDQPGGHDGADADQVVDDGGEGGHAEAAAGVQQGRGDGDAAEQEQLGDEQPQQGRADGPLVGGSRRVVEDQVEVDDRRGRAARTPRSGPANVAKMTVHTADIARQPSSSSSRPR